MKAIFKRIWVIPSVTLCLFSLLLMAGSTQAADKGASATPDWYFPKIVDAEFVAQVAKIPPRNDVTIVDSRPVRKYHKGHIVPAISIPQRQQEEMKDLLPADKSTLIVFYCGGLKCPLSHKAAFQAEAMGYTNLRVYAAGYPDWIKNGHVPGVSETYVKKLIDTKADAMLVDSRPARKFKKGSVPTAINIPYRQFDEMTQLLPTDKNKELIFFCGGYKCPLSPKSAAKANQLGYTKTKLFQGGYPAWKKTVASAK